MVRLIPVILCGGSGTRLWPFSRSGYPKQFVEFEKGKTLFKTTVERISGLPGVENLVVVCNEAHRYLARRNLAELQQEGTVIIEPLARNTAPAIALAAVKAMEENPDAVLLVLPSDHALEGRAVFAKAIENAVELALSGHLVTFGIQPTGPETGFGYIESGDILDNRGFSVKRFVEKPDLAKAKKLLAAGGYFWNSGMFVFKAATYLESLKTFAPEMHAHCQSAMTKATLVDDFVLPDAADMETCPSDSIDYAVMEKTAKAAVVPLNVVWNDLGAWNALHAVADKDEDNNVLVGDTLPVDCKNCYLHSTGRLVAAVGLQDVAVVETSDAVLVTPLSRAQDVKTVVTKLKLAKRVEAELPPVVQRPWGTYESVVRGAGYQAKRIVVNPGGALSLQLHHHRSEHWTVVAGTAEITVGETVKTCSVNDSVYIPVETVHRLVNKTDQPAVIVEVQIGDYLGEDDIVRLADVYSRN